MNLYITYTKKILYSPIFYISIFGVALIFYFGGSYIPIEHLKYGIVDYFDTALELGFYRKMVMIFAAMPFCANFCNEWNHNVTNNIIIRSNLKKYITSNIVVCFITAFVVAMAGMCLFLFAMRIKFPFYSGIDLNTYTETYLQLYKADTILKYFFFLAFNYAISIAGWAVSGLAVSSVFTNPFIAICSPLVFCYVLEYFTVEADKYFTLAYLALSKATISQNPYISSLYIATVFILMGVIFGAIFAFFVRKRVRNEII